VRGKETEVRGIAWDLVVIDEAHRLRNVYKPTHVIAKSKQIYAEFDAQDEVDEQRDRLINQIEGKLEQASELRRLFTIRWSLG
jgi:hypothetical protein